MDTEEEPRLWAVRRTWQVFAKDQGEAVMAVDEDDGRHTLTEVEPVPLLYKEPAA